MDPGHATGVRVDCLRVGRHAGWSWRATVGPLQSGVAFVNSDTVQMQSFRARPRDTEQDISDDQDNV